VSTSIYPALEIISTRSHVLASIVRLQSNDTDSKEPAWKTPRTMPMERYEFMSNVWKDGIFGMSEIVLAAEAYPKRRLERLYHLKPQLTSPQTTK
jgi:hypothetical protein